MNFDRNILISDPNERGALMGRFLAMLHSFMALQTGITWMEPTERLDRFDKNLWLIGVACLHYLHEMVDAELTGAMNDLRSVRRRLAAMATLLALAVGIDVHLVANYQLSTWFIPVFIFTLELIIKAHTSFVVYYMIKNDVSEGRGTLSSKLKKHSSKKKSSGRKSSRKRANWWAGSLC